MGRGAGIVAGGRRPCAVNGPSTEIAREGAGRMPALARETEVEAGLDRHEDDRHDGGRPPDGRRRAVRQGPGPERTIQAGSGALEVRRPKVRDRAAGTGGGERARCGPAVLPRRTRRSRSLDALLPVLDPRGLPTGVRALLRAGHAVDGRPAVGSRPPAAA